MRANRSHKRSFLRALTLLVWGIPRTVTRRVEKRHRRAVEQIGWWHAALGLGAWKRRAGLSTQVVCFASCAFSRGWMTPHLAARRPGEGSLGCWSGRGRRGPRGGRAVLPEGVDIEKDPPRSAEASTRTGDGHLWRPVRREGEGDRQAKHRRWSGRIDRGRRARAGAKHDSNLGRERRYQGDAAGCAWVVR